MGTYNALLLLESLYRRPLGRLLCWATLSCW